MQNLWESPPPPQRFFSHVRDFVIVSAIVFNYLVQATLQGKPNKIQFTPGILTVCLLNRFDQFFLIVRACIVERLYGSEKTKIKNVGVRQVGGLCEHGKI